MKKTSRAEDLIDGINTGQITSNSFIDQQQPNERQVSNRTPLLEHYGSRNNNVTSVPRPTIASEIKMLKEMSRGSPGGLSDMLNSY